MRYECTFWMASKYSSWIYGDLFLHFTSMTTHEDSSQQQESALLPCYSGIDDALHPSMVIVLMT